MGMRGVKMEEEVRAYGMLVAPRLKACLPGQMAELSV